MTSILAKPAALHQAYWENDPGYRRAWYFWPQAASLLALLLIFDRTAEPGAAPEAPWVKPVAPTNPRGAATTASETDRAACAGNNPDTALAVCGRLIESLLRTDPWLAEAYFMRARAYQQKGLMEPAIADLTQSIALAPSSPGSLNFRGAIYLAQGRYDLAIADFRAALAAKPGWALPHANLGLAYLRKNDVDQALAEANEALRIEPNLSWARIVRAQINNARQQWPEVVDDATAAISASPKNGEAFFLRGEAKVRLSDLQGAMADLQEATRLGYRSIFLEMNKGYLNEKLGNIDQALLDYTAAIKLDPKSIFALQKRAAIYFGKGDYADAVANTSTVLDIEPKNYDARILRARANMARGSYEPALSDVDIALSMQPGDAFAHYLRGAISLRTEMTKPEHGPGVARAIDELSEALRLKADLAVAYADRGMAYMLLGKRQEAATDWRTAYKLDSSTGAMWEGKVRNLDVGAGGVAGVVLAGSAMATDMSVCNEFRAPIRAAFAYEKDGKYTAAGWWRVEPKACQKVPFPFEGTTLYYMAISDAYKEGRYTKTYSWGNKVQLFLPDKDFQFDNASQRRPGASAHMFSTTPLTPPAAGKTLSITVQYKEGGTTIVSKPIEQ